MLYDNNYLLKLIEDHGVMSTLKMVDIEKIEDDQIKIILRTIDYSIYALGRELQSRQK